MKLRSYNGTNSMNDRCDIQSGGSTPCDDDRKRTLKSRNSTTESCCSRTKSCQSFKRCCSTFKNGTFLLCYFDNLLWDVTVLNYDSTRNKYLIHYVNFGAEYDEWVKPSRLKLVNKKTRIEQQELNGRYEEAIFIEEQRKLSKEQQDLFAAISNQPCIGYRGGQLGAELNNASIDMIIFANYLHTNHHLLKPIADTRVKFQFYQKVYDHMNLIERVVSEDRDMICDCELVTMLPHAPSIRTILERFTTVYCGPDLKLPMKNSLTGIICSALEKMFPGGILYGLENQQYVQLSKKVEVVALRKEVVDIYGAKHLLRITDMIPKAADNSTLLVKIVSKVNEALQKYVVGNVELKSIIYTNKAITSTISRIPR